MAHDRLIFVVGTPSGGTSAVAGALHHLGVDMGEPIDSVRPYETFEDRRVSKYARHAPLCDVSREIMPEQNETLRDFRSYCRLRLDLARGDPCGVKIGPTVWLGDPEPETLPVRIVRVRRPLEDCIRSNWHYGGEESQDAIRRAMQVAGYWACADALCRKIEPVMTIDYYQLLRYRQTHLASLITVLGLPADARRLRAAIDFLDPEMRHV